MLPIPHIRCLMLLLLIGVAFSEEPKPDPMPAGLKGDFETIEAKVDQVFQYTDGEFRYLAYQITYKGSAIVVPVMFPKNVAAIGTNVKVMVNRIEIPQKDKPPVRQLQFMVMDFEGFGD